MSDPVVIGRPHDKLPRRPLLRTMLGDVLRRTRLEQGRTLTDVARAARVSMPYLSEVERGRKEASSEVLAAICDALRIDLADLLAATGRDLTADGERQARIVRLDSIRSTGAPGPQRGPGDATCLLAA
jgi:transcriptional regulator with XRE-family HTH domain